MDDQEAGELAETVAGLAGRSTRLEDAVEKVQKTLFEYLTRGRRETCNAPGLVKASEDRVLAELKLEIAKLRGGITLQLLTAILTALAVAAVAIFK